MPRLARLDAPGVLHHVIIRGIERRKIFRDSKDQDDFLGRFEDLIPGTKTSCYAWALLSKHANFLLRTGDASLAFFMRRLFTGYAGRLGMSQQGVVYGVRRGERIVIERGIELTHRLN